MAEPHSAAAGLRLLCLAPSIPLGGMERAAIRLTEALAARGAATHYIADARWGAAVRARIESGGGRWTGVPFVSALSRPRNAAHLAWTLRSLALSAQDIERAAAEFGPRQLLATSLGPAYFARRLARRADVTSVFRLPNPPALSQTAVKRPIDRWVWRAVHRDYDHLVCNSRHTARRLADLLGDEAKIRVIRNLAPDVARPAVSDAPPAPMGRRLVYLGRIAAEKGVEPLIEATLRVMARRGDVELLLAGPDGWRDPFGARIRARAAASGVGERIRFLGEIADVAGLLRGAAAHVCPSISDAESAPNAVLDAKRAGVPSVVTPVAGLPEMVRHEQDGLIAAAPDAAALEAALARLLDDAALRIRLADGAARSVDAYAEPRIAHQWTALFSSGAVSIPARSARPAGALREAADAAL